MIIVDILQYSLAGILGFLLCYELMLSIIALAGQNITNFPASRNRKFAIILPAQDENVISKILYSLSCLVYPKSMFDLVVVVNDSYDESAIIARNLGAKVLERGNGKSDKGYNYSLKWVVDEIMKWNKSYDAIIVFDSDSLVSGNYLEVMNYYLDKNCDVIQSCNLILPRPDHWNNEATRIGFLLQNYVKPMGRKVLGLPMGLRGNGMCFSTEILRKIPWQNDSSSQAIDYGLRLQLEGVKIHFAPEAHVLTKMPDRANCAEKQRKKWELGRYLTIHKYSRKLLGNFVNQRSFSFLDSFIELITPPLVNTLLFVSTMIGVNLFLWFFELNTGWFLYLWLGIAVVGVLYLFIGLFAAGADRQIYKSIFYIPLYIFWKIKIYIKSFWDRRKYQRFARAGRKPKHVG
jgi:cellulose synthase/poly-beta-1,6-N-acetylglucosamine synthase-like glycosyltransferase